MPTYSGSNQHRQRKSSRDERSDRPYRHTILSRSRGVPSRIRGRGGAFEVRLSQFGDMLSTSADDAKYDHVPMAAVALHPFAYDFLGHRCRCYVCSADACTATGGEILAGHHGSWV
jgi:hypothetical protein